MDSDESYFAQRAEEERAAAEEASDRSAKRAHLESAEELEELSAALELAHRPTL